MIIWINGAWGVGKTTCAYELNRRLSHSIVYDPENIGYFIRENIPSQLHEPNFQDHKLWRAFNYEILKYLVTTHDGIIIVPMTLINRQYYDEIIGLLREEGIEVKHYILYAEKKTIEKRLNKRVNQGRWARARIDQCHYAFNHDITEEKIITDNKKIDCVIEELAERSGLALLHDNRSTLRKIIDRSMVLIKHIR